MSELGHLVEAMDQKQMRLAELMQAAELDDATEQKTEVMTQGQDNEEGGS